MESLSLKNLSDFVGSATSEVNIQHPTHSPEQNRICRKDESDNSGTNCSYAPTLWTIEWLLGRGPTYGSTHNQYVIEALLMTGPTNH